MAEPGYCGCCGAQIADYDRLWCDRCESTPGHLGIVGDLVGRIYFARTGRPCLFAAAGDGTDQEAGR